VANDESGDMSGLLVKPAGSAFPRPGGREGQWWPDPEDDDTVASPFDFIEVKGEDAEAAVEVLRRQLSDMTPVMFGSPHEAALLFERMAIFETTPDAWLAGMAAFDLDAWFVERVSEVKDWQAQSGKVIPERGPWPKTDKRWLSLTVPKDPISDTFHPTIIVGLIPTAAASDIGAYTRFGGWNDCPKPAVHIALAREWLERYGAVPVAQTYETLEFKVARPVAGREEAERLALEHFHYCRESVSDTLQAAAAELIGSSVWHFWWD
jgi:Domain of unknown function (DUF4253)